MGILVLVFAAIKKPMLSGIMGIIALVVLIWVAIQTSFLIFNSWEFLIAFIGALLGFIFGILKK